jgi:sec-independent protein translocase protein TatA
VLVVLAIAYSRLYLDAHWLLDVVGGLTGGGAYLLFGIAALRALLAPPIVTDRRRRRPAGGRGTGDPTPGLWTDPIAGSRSSPAGRGPDRLSTPPPSRRKRGTSVIGTQDLLIALVIAVFLFGAKRLPELAGAVGKAMREFRQSAAGDSDESVQTAPTPGPAACASCQAPLAADWTHCPRCGVPVGGALPSAIGPG